MVAYVHSHIYLIVIFSFLLGLLFFPIIIKIARAKHWLVRPNKRTSHTGEVPNVGGVAICLSVLLVFIFFVFPLSRADQILLLCMLLITALGFVDDIMNLTPKNKVVAEFAISLLLFYYAGFRITTFGGLFGIEKLNIFTSFLVSFGILLYVINAINLIDGVDGLASGLGILFCTIFGQYFYYLHNYTMTLLAFSMIGVLSIFFIYNVFGGTRRKIFMGDSGSLLLGFLVSIFVIQFCELNNKHIVTGDLWQQDPFGICITILTVPLFDTARLIFVRLKNKKNPFYPDKKHIHHILLNLGMKHVQVTVVLLMFSGLFCYLAWIGRHWNFWMLIGIDAAIYFLFVSILRYFEIKKSKKQKE